MPAQTQTDPVQLRRADNNERFVAFAFAGAELMAEAEACGTITYAAGAFRSRLGQPPEAFVGRPLRSLVAPVDHDVLDCAFSLLLSRGRVAPMMIRLSDDKQTRLALAAIALPATDRPVRLCVTFALPPEPSASVLRAGNPQDFARATEARLRAGTPCDVGLLEIAGPGSTALVACEAVGQALEAVGPGTVAGELAPGRYGLLGAGGTPAQLHAASLALEAQLRAQGIEVAVTAHHLNLSAEGLTPTQAARALRQALNAFAREGSAGLQQSGLGTSLAAYLRDAGRRTDTLLRAIRGGRFNLTFQPIVSLATRATHHFEALIRPQPIADLPLATPQDFVMLVEALGLASELDLRVAGLACEQASRTGRSIAFNLSGQSVQDGRFREQLVTLLSASQASRDGHLMVEMTETAEIEDTAAAAKTAAALRAIGVPFCLDDFGAGVADMRLLRALAPDVVKLDGSYVAGVTELGRERAFVAGMVKIARAGAAEIVAERIETEAEAAALASLGVQYGQGWLFGRAGPLPQPGRKPAGVRVGEVDSWE